MVLRDRKHPGVFAWDMRNQVQEAKDSLAIATGREMADFIRAIDNDYVIGNFTWTAMDFMGEVCLGWNSGKLKLMAKSKNLKTDTIVLKTTE